LFEVWEGAEAGAEEQVQEVSARCEEQKETWRRGGRARETCLRGGMVFSKTLSNIRCEGYFKDI
jgi:hypothetical protein